MRYSTAAGARARGPTSSRSIGGGGTGCLPSAIEVGPASTYRSSTGGRQSTEGCRASSRAHSFQVSIMYDPIVIVLVQIAFRSPAAPLRRVTRVLSTWMELGPSVRSTPPQSRSSFRGLPVLYHHRLASPHLFCTLEMATKDPLMGFLPRHVKATQVQKALVRPHFFRTKVRASE